ncbi:PLP-dependent transferase [Rhodofomes roseus]|uniref:PLP-dependent transferase n=1 Tax=Rhodofomes roseus TaxID=34475 RepID=A0ABQ8K8B2_9APHY|nr:PLP-dependent transferase [Rhodofomes roseus]KAH9833420.1 PLP-dependent transferase [Rhodofomes roseus]
MPSLDIATVRSAFPALSSGFLYADNAGGSQCLADAVAHISDYLLNTNVQLGADYAVSQKSTSRVASGADAAKELFNADSVDEVAFGSSATMLVENLTRAIEKDVNEGDEIIVTGEHEVLVYRPANAGPWKRLAARRGAIIKLWRPSQIAASPNNPYAVSLQLEALLPLVTAKTRLLAFTACSNILGSVVPVKQIVRAVREKARELGVPKLEVCVDCVAYAPHRRIDVKDWDIEYCVFSVYKVYGPHASVLYIRAPALTHSLSSLAHHFLSVDTKPYKVQPGGPGYEIVYGCTAVPPYLKSLAPSGALADAYDLIAEHEQTLLTPLLAYLRGKTDRGVRVVGDEYEGPSRVPTVSFVVAGERPIRSKDVVKAFDDRGDIGIRYGHFYAYTLVDTLQPKLNVDDAVVRISFVHYNTVEEVEKIIKVLDEVLA